MVSPKAGSDGDAVAGEGVPVAAERGGHQFGGGQGSGAGGDGDEAGAHAEGSQAGHPDRAGFADRAADGEDAAEATLVAFGGPESEQVSPQAGFIFAQANFIEHRGGGADGAHRDLPESLPQQVGALRRREGHRVVSADDGSGSRSRVGAHAGGQIDGRRPWQAESPS